MRTYVLCFVLFGCRSEAPAGSDASRPPPVDAAVVVDAAATADAPDALGVAEPWGACGASAGGIPCGDGWQCENRRLVQGIDYWRCVRPCEDGEDQECAPGGMCGRWFPEASVPRECLRRATHYESCDAFTACPEDSLCTGLSAFADGSISSFCLPVCGASAELSVSVVESCPPIPRALQAYRAELTGDIPTACHRVAFPGSTVEVCVAVAQVGGYCDQGTHICEGLLDVERPDTVPDDEAPVAGSDVGDLSCGWNSRAGGTDPWLRSGTCTRICAEHADCECPDEDPNCPDPNDVVPGMEWRCAGLDDPTFRVCVPVEPCMPGGDECADNPFRRRCVAAPRRDSDGDGIRDAIPPGWPEFRCGI